MLGDFRAALAAAASGPGSAKKGRRIAAAEERPHVGVVDESPYWECPFTVWNGFGHTSAEARELGCL